MGQSEERRRVRPRARYAVPARALTARALLAALPAATGVTAATPVLAT